MIKPFYIDISDISLEELKEVEDKLIGAGSECYEEVCKINFTRYRFYGVDTSNLRVFYEDASNYDGPQIRLDELDDHLGDIPKVSVPKLSGNDIKAVRGYEFAGNFYVTEEEAKLVKARDEIKQILNGLEENADEGYVVTDRVMYQMQKALINLPPENAEPEEWHDDRPGC